MTRFVNGHELYCHATSVSQSSHCLNRLMEQFQLVEGDDLTDRILRGPIPIDDAPAIAGQIADAPRDWAPRGQWSWSQFACAESSK